MAPSFDYAELFNGIDLAELKQDMLEVMTTSQDWWPADYGHYGPFFIRMAWHSAGTYRIGDGRGGSGRGTIRFAPLGSWPDNANLDKSRRLLWPLKQKYGDAISWADLMIFAGNCAIESMGLPPVGFGGGREDVWEPDEDISWGPEEEFLADERHNDDRVLQNPLAATQLGLIYVNPEGPNASHDFLAAAVDIRQTFSRMAMNDEETVALIAGGHTFGKCHGAAAELGPPPDSAPLEEQGLGWLNTVESGNAQYTNTSNLEGAWTYDPISWDNSFFEILFENEWVLTPSPAGGMVWTPENPSTEIDETAPDAHIPDLRHPPIMLTTDLTLRFDPIYGPISQRFLENPAEFDEAFANAWYKLTHRDMGPRSRYLGSMVLEEDRIWQDPIPASTGGRIFDNGIRLLREAIADSGLSVSQMVTTAWASASTFRDTDNRGGANGARILLDPQRDWEVNQPEGLGEIFDAYASVQNFFNRPGQDKFVSMADLIVLGGSVGIEQAARNAGIEIEVPFEQGRTDATLEQTDVESFAVLEPIHDGFRNYIKAGLDLPVDHLLVERANLLCLTAPEMTVLLGGMRVLGTNFGGSTNGVFTDRPETLTNDFFVNLLDNNTEWRVSASDPDLHEGYDRATGEDLWTGTAVDLVFGSNSILRSYAEVYAQDDNAEKFVRDFVAAWTKVMNADRFDLLA